MSKPSLVVLLVEDDRHKMLLNRYLLEFGLNYHQIRTEPFPAGRGSAEQWVRNEFARQVAAYRRRQAKSALVVAIDADNHTVAQRIAQLDHALEEQHKPAITDEEQIARLVPKRNIETWILCLNLHTVNEETDYKNGNHDWTSLTPPAAKTLCDWTRPNAVLPSGCIDSLRYGIGELKRLALKD